MAVFGKLNEDDKETTNIFAEMADLVPGVCCVICMLCSLLCTSYKIDCFYLISVKYLTMI